MVLKLYFSYDSQRICINLDVHDIQEHIILRAIWMNFTWDHPTQSKARLLKGGGYLACMRHNYFANREGTLREDRIPLYEHNEEYIKFALPRHTTKSLFEVMTNWRLIPKVQNEPKLLESVDNMLIYFINIVSFL